MLRIFLFLLPRHRLTRHQYYLQLRKDILEDRLYCNEETGLFLVALALQAEFGDYMPEVDKTKNICHMHVNASLSFNGCHRATFGCFVCLFSCMVRIITSQSIICRRGCWKNWRCPLSRKTCQDYMQVMLRCFLRRQRQSTSRFLHHRYICDHCFNSFHLL